MPSIEFQEVGNEIARQMGCNTIDEALIKGDWLKVDPDLRDTFNQYIARLMVIDLFPNSPYQMK